MKLRDKTIIEQMYPDVVSWRRKLHREPELSFQEAKTAQMIYEQLQRWGIEARTNVGGHGVVGFVEGAKAGPTVALRADIDALPIQDQKTTDYASQVPGVMHACGHDGHTAVLLGLAKLFNEHKSELKGNIRLIFQHAEEIAPGGAKSMIEHGALDGVDVIYGAHLWTPLQVGQVASIAGPMMAAVDEFTIEIEGRGGHAGLPHDCVDSIVVGSHLVVQLQSIISRYTNPVQPCVITVGSMHAGTNNNIIAEKCVLKGTVRSFHEPLRQTVREKFAALVDHTCTMFGASAELTYKACYPTVINAEIEANRFFGTAARIFGDQAVESSSLIMAAEDFSYYLNEIPGCYMLVGAGNIEDNIIYPHHHPKFDLDERSMLQAMQLLLSITLDYMDDHA